MSLLLLKLLLFLVEKADVMVDATVVSQASPQHSQVKEVAGCDMIVLALSLH